jgi:hypothetical protein
MAAALPTVKSPKSRVGMLLPIDYKLGENDVYVGRSNLYRFHTGNLRFNDIVHANLERYYSTSSRREKTSIIYEIVDQVRLSSPDGGFVKRSKENGRWYEVGDRVAVSAFFHAEIFLVFKKMFPTFSHSISTVTERANFASFP